MSSTVEELKKQHKQMSLEKRTVDRKTEDTRTNTIDESNKLEAEIEALEEDLASLKDEYGVINDKNTVRTHRVSEYLGLGFLSSTFELDVLSTSKIPKVFIRNKLLHLIKPF